MEGSEHLEDSEQEDFVPPYFDNPDGDNYDSNSDEITPQEEDSQSQDGIDLNIGAAVVVTDDDEDEEDEEDDEDDDDDEDDEDDEIAATEEPEVANAVGFATSVFANLPRGKSKSFAERLEAADENTKQNYATLSEELLSYKKVSKRVSRKCDSYRTGRKLMCKIVIRGKSLKCYLALDPNEYPTSKFSHKDVSEKKSYASVPMLMRVKSPRSVKRTLKLIGDVAAKFELKRK